MKPIFRLVVLCGVLAFLSSPLSAQARPSPCPWNGQSFGPLMVNSVTGCPFSAAVEMTLTQTLADGTYIQRTTRTRSYRDSLGRIRYESFAPAEAGQEASETPSLIEIFDPVAGFQYFILTDRSTAYRRPIIAPAITPTLPANNQSSVAARSASRPAESDGSKAVIEDLGTQWMVGQSVTGSRFVETIPVGVGGNDRELKVVSEWWRSPDIDLVLLQKTSDPRSGDNEKRVTNLVLSEPDPSLFRVPADYAVVNQ